MSVTNQSNLAAVLENLPQRDRSMSFGADIDAAHAVLLDPSASLGEKDVALRAWVQRNQPCLFGRLAAREARGPATNRHTLPSTEEGRPRGAGVRCFEGACDRYRLDRRRCPCRGRAARRCKDPAGPTRMERSGSSGPVQCVSRLVQQRKARIRPARGASRDRVSAPRQPVPAGSRPDRP